MDLKILYSQRENCTTYRLFRNNEVYFLKYFRVNKKETIETQKERLEKAECIARIMVEAGIPAICAIPEGKRYIHHQEDTLYAIYPWINGIPMTGDVIDSEICYEVGKIIGKIHRLALKDDAIALPSCDEEDTNLSEMIGFPKNLNNTVLQAISILKRYSDKEQMLHEQDKILTMSQRNILCHRDTVMPNFLLVDGKFVLIDWEHSGYEYPEFELLDTCLEWSNFRFGTNWRHYRDVVKGYYSEVAYTDQIPYDALIDRMLLSILRRIRHLLLTYFETKEFDYEKKIKSYVEQLIELEDNRMLYIENLKP